MNGATWELHAQLRRELEKGRRTVGSALGCVYTRTADGERMLCQASSSVAEGAPLSFGLAAEDCEAIAVAMSQGEALAVNDALSDGRVAAVAKSRFGLRAALYAPFSVGGRDGVAIFSERRRHAWSLAQKEAAMKAAACLGRTIAEGSPGRPWSERLWHGFPGWCGVMRGGVLVDGWWSDHVGDGITIADLFGRDGSEQLMRKIERVGAEERDHVTLQVRCRARSYRVQFGALGDGYVALFIQPTKEEGAPSDGELRALAAELGHELNNALQYLANVLDVPTEIAAAAHEVVARGGRLTDQLLAYTGSARRTSATRMQVVDSSEVHDVLIVEDDRTVARSLSRVLRRHGATVRVAENVAEGLEQVREQRPDALLLDMILPDGTGHDLLVELGDEIDGVEVLVMTGYADAETLRRVRSLGLPVLAKPFDPAEVAARLGLDD